MNDNNNNNEETTMNIQDHNVVPNTTNADKISHIMNNSNNENHKTDDNDDGDDKSVSSIDQQQQSTASLYKVLTLVKPEWMMLLIGVIAMIGAEVTDLINPILLGKAYDDLLDVNQTPDIRMKSVNRTMIIIMILHCIGCILIYIQFSILLIIGERIVCRLRCTLYRLMLSFEMYFFDTNKSGELVSRLSSDTSLLQEGASQSLPEVCIGFIKVIASISIMFLISSKLSALLIAFLLIVMGLSIPFMTLLSTLSNQYQNILGIANSYTTETLQSMRTVQSFCAEEKEAQRYESKIGHPSNYSYWIPNNTNSDDNPTTEIETTCYSAGYNKSLTE